MYSFCRSKGADGNSIIPYSSIIVIIAISTCSSTTFRIHTIIMNLGTFQLSYVNRIGIFLTGCDVGNLTGNVLSRITNRNSSSFRLPNASRIFIVVNSRRIITDYILIHRSYRISTESYTAINLCICIVAENNGFFLLCCNWRLFISIADNDVIGLTLCYRTIITDYCIRIGVFVNRNTLSQNLYMTGIYYRILKTINRIIGADTAFFSYHFIIHTNNRCLLGVIRFISTTNSKSSTATFAIVYFLQ